MSFPSDPSLHRCNTFTFSALVFIGLFVGGCQDAASPSLGQVVDDNADEQSADERVVILRSNGVSDDPRGDGWTSEVFSSQANTRINGIIETLLNDGGALQQREDRLIAHNFRCSEFRPRAVKSVVDTGPLQVFRWQRSTDPALQQRQGQQALADSVAEWTERIGSRAIEKKIKLTRVQVREKRGSTEARIELSGTSADQSVQITAIVDCDWQVAGDQLLLSAMNLKSYEETTLQTEHQTWFRELTAAVMARVPTYHHQLCHSDDHWAQRIERRLGANFMGYHGVTVGDVNGDLLDDLYVCQTGGLPNQLLIQQPDGTLLAQQDSGVDILDSSRAALLVDLDNDDDQDLVVASITGTLFYENTGHGIERTATAFKFRHRVRESRLGYSIVAADYDLDGDLDIYACCYHAPPDSEFAYPVPYYDARNGAANVLIANDGDWKFHDATQQSGLDADNDRWSYAACWEDYDRDGDPDLYVANDFGRNCLYVNDQGRFTNRAELAGVEDIASGMSAAWGDYNRDGHMDLYVSNMFSSAGGRVTYQRKFKANASDATKQKLQRLARGNSLFESQADGTFRDVTLAAGVEMGRWAWSSNFIDIDNDGWEDLLVANGNYTGEDSGDL